MSPGASVDVGSSSELDSWEPELAGSLPLLVLDDPVLDVVEDDAEVLVPVGPTVVVDELDCEVDEVAVAPLVVPVPPVFPLVPVFDVVEVVAGLPVGPLVAVVAVDELDSMGGADVSAGEHALTATNTVNLDTVEHHTLSSTPTVPNFMSLAFHGLAPRRVESTSRRLQSPHARSPSDTKVFVAVFTLWWTTMQCR